MRRGRCCCWSGTWATEGVRGNPAGSGWRTAGHPGWGRGSGWTGWKPRLRGKLAWSDPVEVKGVQSVEVTGLAVGRGLFEWLVVDYLLLLW